jgi:hypothetical protein
MHPTADRKAIKTVCYLETVWIIERDRPEGVHWRRGTLLEVQRVFVGAIERPAGFVTKIERVDRILEQVRAEALLRNDGALEIVVPIDAH